MRLRSGFVSNSSSTSFLIISKGAFTKKKFQRLMGVKKNSPLLPLFEQLYNDMIEGTNVELDLGTIKGNAYWKSLLGRRANSLSERMIEKLDACRKKGWHAYYGRLDSESNPVQTFFCMDSFEEENDEVYLNGLECAW